MDALDFLKMFPDSSLDGVLYDPPYSNRQVLECYKGVGLPVDSKTTYGWNSGGIGKKYGFEITRILLVPHGGHHNDTIVTVERKVK